VKGEEEKGENSPPTTNGRSTRIRAILRGKERRRRQHVYRRADDKKNRRQVSLSHWRKENTPRRETTGALFFIAAA